MQDTQITYQSKAMSYLLYFTAIMLSAVSAYYSIAGLAAIFAAALIPIVIMGGVLEFAKLVVASWLFRSWKTIPWLMKTYFTFALIVLMALTSMGIFGFLSKAHLDQAVPTSDVAAKISIIDEKIKTERENIESSRKALKQMDETVDQTIARSKTDQGAVNANTMRNSQAKERTQIQANITKAQGEIAKLNIDRSPIASELRKVEAEVGPIKYIASLVYGDNPDQTILEKAVRIVIIMIVTVFDPLAVLLLMAAGIPVLKRKENDTRNQTSSEEIRTEETKQTSPSIIKKRFVTKFAERPKEPYVGQQTAISSEPSTVDDRRSASPSSDTNSSGTSAGVTTRTEDLSTEQNKVSVWDVNSGKGIDYDSIGRRITPHIPGELLETKQKTIEVEVEELQTDKKV
jgi:hypothetical protein